MSRIKPKKGDLIEIFHALYQHWAIYVGDGYVIHLTSASEKASAGSSSSLFSKSAVVKKEKLSDVLGCDEHRINNLLDDKYEPRDIEVIVDEAESLVGQTRHYSLIRENCEHFVTGLRYGKPECRQVRNVVAAIKVAIPPVRVLDAVATGTDHVLDAVAIGTAHVLHAVAIETDHVLHAVASGRVHVLDAVASGPVRGLRAAASVASAVFTDKYKKNKY